MAKKTKENVIDSDLKLADEFKIRKLLLRAWRCFLIYRMNNIRSQHARKLSRTYMERKALYKHLAMWKLYIMRILPEEKLYEHADRHREWNLL